MANYRAGDIIRLTRNASGMTQEQLSEGVCSVETLSRIENGKHSVKKSTYAQLMAKMERDTRKNYALCTSADMELLEERIWVEDALSKHDYAKAEQYLHVLKKKIDDSEISRQYVGRIEGVVDYRLGKIDVQEYVGRMDKAIKITVPDYEKYLAEEKSAYVYPFTELEVMTLVSLANAYGNMEKPDKSIRIFDLLLRCLEEGYMDEKSVGRLKMVIGRNYVMALERMGKYQEALEMAKEILESAISNNYGRMIPVMLLSISWNLQKICKDKEGSIESIVSDIKKKLRQAYYIAAARNDYVNLKIIKDYYQECIGEELE